jgi:DNA-binding CsgD family transcriptional regulator
MDDYIILTQREAEVLRLRLQGLSQAEIARLLETSKQNVARLVGSLRHKGFDA